MPLSIITQRMKKVSPAHGVRNVMDINKNTKPLKRKVQNMKLFAFSLLAGACALLATGCSSTTTNRLGSQIEIENRVKIVPQIQPGNKYVTGSSKCTVYLGFIRVGDVSKQVVGVSFAAGSSFWGGGTDVYQRAALYDACAKSKADIILCPQYVRKIEGNIFVKDVSCTVKGFPGYIKGVKVVPDPYMMTISSNTNCCKGVPAPAKAAPKSKAASKK